MEAGLKQGGSPAKRRRGVSLEGISDIAVIPDKLFFKIGEAARLTGVKPYVLRYWESEFSVLKPEKSRTGQRLYRREDIAIILRIKELLYKDGYTIAGAKQCLLQKEEETNLQRAAETLRKVKEVLLDISAVLAR